MTTATATDSTFTTGDNVKRFDVQRGWLFGKVVSVHFTDYESSVGGPHWRATVQWIRHVPESLPQSCLESYPGEPVRLGMTERPCGYCTKPTFKGWHNGKCPYCGKPE